ncbi:STAS domain-containing protein [Candidatus Aquicultor secundus]|uniref:STAS domain-containing protein n=1 Tax=Candidatus Aquicultor secundus TaxID=1973895 RepID=UPI00257CCE15|nr:STAS domain-containing protein [Candidatus Aquicultor secundus]NCO65430.1 STAS domain-containing protein [Solirubrobacter sp.]
MEVQVLPGRIPIIDVDGEIDHYVVPELESKIMAFINEGHASVILDFSDVSYIDSAGIALIILSIQRSGPLGGKVGLVVTNENVIKILEIVGITKLAEAFSLYSSVDEALASMTGERPSGNE